jgi:hypothetical protein
MQMEMIVNNLVLQYLGTDSNRHPDQVSHYKLIHVHNAASGGSNTATGTAILDYHLLPQPSYDVIINAFSTNDMHVYSMNEAQAAGLNIRQATFDMAQNFTRVALQKCTLPDAKTPLLLWLDDYLGNEQRQILTTTELSLSVQVLANYYAFGFISYADTVRDLVYGTTNETMFSPAVWYSNPKKSKDTTTMQREIHPGFTMHLATAYIMSN